MRIQVAHCLWPCVAGQSLDACDAGIASTWHITEQQVNLGSLCLAIYPGYVLVRHVVVVITRAIALQRLDLICRQEPAAFTPRSGACVAMSRFVQIRLSFSSTSRPHEIPTLVSKAGVSSPCVIEPDDSVPPASPSRAAA